jgi:predicted DNA-binding transcriptional regulator YafY
MARGDQLSRQWRLLRLLEHRAGRTVEDLATELGVTTRTVRRDLDVAHNAGWPVTSVSEDGRVRWQFVEGFKASTHLPLSLTELLALYFSRDLLKPLAGTLFEDSVESFYGKINALLPPEGRAYLDQLQGLIATNPRAFKDYRQHRQLLEALTNAARARRTVRVRYFSFAREHETTRRIDPYRLWYHGGGLYVIGYCHTRKDVRTFAVERIRHLELTPDTFTVHPDFDFKAYTRDAFGIMRDEAVTVRVRFRRDQAKYARERLWHPSQTFEDHEDGSLTITLQVAPTIEVKRWVFGFGAAAEVLEPDSLRREIAAEARKIADREA